MKSKLAAVAISLLVASRLESSAPSFARQRSEPDRILFFVLKVEKEARHEGRDPRKQIHAGPVIPPLPVREGERFYLESSGRYWAVKYSPERSRWFAMVIGPSEDTTWNTPHQATVRTGSPGLAEALGLIPAADPKGSGKRPRFLLPLPDERLGTRFPLVVSGAMGKTTVRVFWDLYGVARNVPIATTTLDQGVGELDLVKEKARAKVTDLARKHGLDVDSPISMRIEALGNPTIKPVTVEVQSGIQWMASLPEEKRRQDDLCRRLNRYLSLYRMKIELRRPPGQRISKGNLLYLLAKEDSALKPVKAHVVERWVLQNVIKLALENTSCSEDEFRALASKIKTDRKVE